MKQLAAFSETVQGEQYNFVVNRDDIGNVGLYLAGSHKKIAKVLGQGPNESAGRAALKDVIERHGEARVRSVLWSEAFDVAKAAGQ
jgi:hypothetical protein